MMCNIEGFRDSERPTLAVQGVQTEPCENSQSSLVERVCAFLERYAIAHGSDANLWRHAGSISGASPRNG
jgi:hypothetical protein